MSEGGLGGHCTVDQETPPTPALIGAEGKELQKACVLGKKIKLNY